MARQKPAKPNHGDQIIAGLQGVLDALKAGGMERVRSTHTVHRVKRVPRPDIVAAEVTVIRESIGLTLPLCAAVLGVSVKTLEDWERDAKPIPAVALRLLDEMKRNPEYWKLRVRELTA